MSTIQVQNRFGDIVAVMTVNAAIETYKFLDKDLILQSLEARHRAIGHAEDGCSYHLVVCG